MQKDRPKRRSFTPILARFWNTTEVSPFKFLGHTDWYNTIFPFTPISSINVHIRRWFRYHASITYWSLIRVLLRQSFRLIHWVLKTRSYASPPYKEGNWPENHVTILKTRLPAYDPSFESAVAFCHHNPINIRFRGLRNALQCLFTLQELTF